LDELASIQVMPLTDRQGQLLHNALLTDLNPKGEPIKPHYRLVISLSTTETQQALRQDDTATRDILNYSVTFWLYEDKTRVVTGSFSQMFSYDFLQEHFANVAAADDIRHRAAQATADEIRNRLAAYFAKAAEVAREKAAEVTKQPDAKP
jgi:LPS-assembly lipoprotein